MLEDVVTASIARAHRNVELGLPFDHGADVDGILVELGLPKRSETKEPQLPAEFVRASGPRRCKRRGPRRK